MKRRPILLNRFNNVTAKGVIIGVIGVSRSVGVTHTAIMIGNYLAKRGKKVALIELNHNYDFGKIEKAYEGPNFNSDVTTDFKINKCIYYKNNSSLSLIDILAKPFDYYVLDIGFYQSTYFEEFLRADIKIVMGLVSEWKKDEIFNFYEINNKFTSANQWLYGFPFATKNDIGDIKKYITNQLISIPFNPDPYIVKGDMQKILQKIV
ncbi:MAG: hypothetical protein ACLFMO_04800 [Eubacteriales bacterium]